MLPTLLIAGHYTLRVRLGGGFIARPTINEKSSRDASLPTVSDEVLIACGHQG